MPYETLEKSVLDTIKKMCEQYIDKSNFENILKSNKSNAQIETDLKVKIQKFNNDINNNIRKIDELYSDKLNGLIDSEMYKRHYNNLILENDKINSEIQKLQEELKNFNENNNSNKINYEKLIEEYLSFENPDKKTLASLIDKIEIDENKNINIYFKIRDIAHSSL